MFIWIIAALVFIALGVVGYYQGVVRVVFSLAGLLLGAVLAMPLSPVFKPVLSLFGLEHPVLLAFLAPFCVYLLILILFKVAGLATHRKVDTYFKYKASDTLRMLFDRLNARVGICVGMVNAMVYVVLIGVVIYTLGYFTLQVGTSSEKDSFWLKSINRLAEDMRSTKLDKAVAAFVPKSARYYDGADIAAIIFLNPLLQNRLSTYPVFLTLNEKPEFKLLGGTAFQDFWSKGPSIQEFRSHDSIKPLVSTGDWYNKFVTMLDGDFKDLKVYLETGKSPKYEDIHILGRWDFDGAASFALAKKRKPIMPLQEIRRLRAVLNLVFKNAVLTATVDKKIILKAPGVARLAAAARLPAGAAQNLKDTGEGTWEPGQGGGYVLTMTEGGKTLFKVDALVEENRLTFDFNVPGTRDSYGLVFEK